MVSFIVMFSPFSNIVFASQAETSTGIFISPSFYDEEINAVQTPPFSKKHASAVLLKYRLSMVDSKTYRLNQTPSTALSIDLCFLEMKCAIPIKYQSNYLY
ncbi:potassium:proton antiporter [Bacillus pumilus]|uniref:Potassium:proton antiporter n=1 Tax=Bacillus pumilus TaxID=1408 RepID=A0A2A5IYQ8_BACPU|nr:potassium:proton antiporter [Bacillus pumilus]